MIHPHKLISSVILVVCLCGCKTARTVSTSFSHRDSLAAALRHHSLYDIKLTDTLDVLLFDTAQKMYVPNCRVLHHGRRQSTITTADTVKQETANMTEGVRQSVRQTAPADLFGGHELTLKVLAVVAILYVIALIIVARKYG